MDLKVTKIEGTGREGNFVLERILLGAPEEHDFEDKEPQKRRWRRGGWRLAAS